MDGQTYIVEIQWQKARNTDLKARGTKLMQSEVSTAAPTIHYRSWGLSEAHVSQHCSAEVAVDRL